MTSLPGIEAHAAEHAELVGHPPGSDYGGFRGLDLLAHAHARTREETVALEDLVERAAALEAALDGEPLVERPSAEDTVAGTRGVDIVEVAEIADVALEGVLTQADAESKA